MVVQSKNYLKGSPHKYRITCQEFFDSKSFSLTEILSKVMKPFSFFINALLSFQEIGLGESGSFYEDVIIDSWRWLMVDDKISWGLGMK